ncbi:MAG: alkaline phosphatase D family protein [Hahellaceae bacterium]|nr:alkaline phosphatase D family protein [Hahellaceae bacterium]
MSKVSRRQFLRLSMMGVGAAVVSGGLQGCLLNSGDAVPIRYDHGVASGDPLSDRVIIWTRVTPEGDPGAGVWVNWEVARDAGFTDLTHTGYTTTNSSRDYTVKVDVVNLEPDTTYYYRFIASGHRSPVGQMKTLPEGDVDQVRMAVFSCANYPAGLFHVYGAAAARDDLDVVVHLGDYLYEYGMGGYATEDAEAIGRALPSDNASELLTLADYRKRYALYHTDTNLQALHQKVPFIAVWDDHEVANDTWREGAQNHNDGEGEFDERKMQALQAYFEWMPIRPASESDEQTIYRSFHFGSLLSLHMMDTRVIARDEQLLYSSYISGNTFNQDNFEADVTSASRTLVGAEQYLWLNNALASSTATWQVLGQQVLMARIDLPAELVTQFEDPDPATIFPAFIELYGIKQRIIDGDNTVTDQERERVENVVPYNLDSWDGYEAERDAILDRVRDLDLNLVVLAGDTHNAWASNLTDSSDNIVGVEFATPSVSSPGLEEYLSLSEGIVGATEGILTTLVDDLEYINVNQRGYMVVTFTPEAAQADWYFAESVKTQTYTELTSRNRSYKTLPGSGNRSLISVS